MKSDYKELRSRLSLKLDQEKPSNSKKKGLWQKIKDFLTQGPERRGSEDWRSRDWDW